MESLHASNPAVWVGSFAFHVCGYLLVGQQQEVLFADRVDDHLGNIFGLEDTVLAGLAARRELVPRTEIIADDVGSDSLWAQHGNLDAGVAVINRQPFGECHRSRLRYSVGAGVDLGKQSCC